MNCKKWSLIVAVIFFMPLGFLNAGTVYADSEPEKPKELKEIVVIEAKSKLEETRVTGPNPELTHKVTITEDEIKSVNAITMVDTLKYMPDTFIRQRFIGDANAPVGIGGTGYFQTADNMVFVDGFPLHFPLRTTFNGSPRWNLVSPREVVSADVTYGPFSALYPGNAMGGVVDIHTRMPDKLEGSLDTTGYFQNFKLHGDDGVYGGFRTHAEYGNKIDKLRIFAFYDHLDAASQPMSYFLATGPRISPTTSGMLPTATSRNPLVAGVIRLPTLTGSDSIMYGDSGSTAVTNDLFKIKAQYEFSSDLVGRAMFTILDHKESLSNPKTYMRDANGNPVWGGTFQHNGVAFTALNSNFSETRLERQGIDAGVGLKGNLAAGWKFDSVFSLYTEPRDLAAASSVNPDDPTYRGTGTVTDINNIGWQTFDLILGNQSFLNNDRLNFFTGYHFDHYSIGIDQYNSNNWLAGTRDSFRASNGGHTQTQAILAQGAWKFFPDWTASLGGRQEWWKTYNGFNNTATVTNNLPERDYSKFSPKFALEFGPSPWSFQFSLAQAWRFPIPGELYETISPTNTATITASSTLKPENGFAKGFLIRRSIDRGEVALNLFEKDIHNNIYAQTLINSLGQQATTFLNIEHTRARGVEFVLKQRDLVLPKLDTNLNVSYVNSEILENTNAPSFVGNNLTLLPTWRLNALNTYHITDKWDGSVGVRYSSRPFFNLANDDYVDTFGAATGYVVADVKTSYRWKWEQYLLQASAGIDNINNNQYFYFHPFPQRTYVFQLSASF